VSSFPFCVLVVLPVLLVILFSSNHENTECFIDEFPRHSSVLSACAQRLRVEPRVQGVVKNCLNCLRSILLSCMRAVNL